MFSFPDYTYQGRIRYLIFNSQRDILEFTTRNISFEREVELPIVYKGKPLATSYRADFICYDLVLVELKAISKIGKVEEAQIINYLKATGLEIGLLFNFAAPSLEYKRFVN